MATSNLTNYGAAYVLSGGDLKSKITHVALFSTNPGVGGSGTEASGSGYSRKAITWSSSGDKDEVSTNTITWTATGNWAQPVTHYGFMDAASSGNMLLTGELSTPRTVVNGSVITVSSGDLGMEAQTLGS